MNESPCLLEHSVEADVSATFAWRFWTNVGNWDDPPAQFTLDGPFADGSCGTTVLPGQEPFRWWIRNVRSGRSATIEMELDRATLGFEWHFAPLSDRKTRLTQRQSEKPVRLLDVRAGRRPDLADSYYEVILEQHGRRLNLPRPISDPGDIDTADYFILSPAADNYRAG